MKNSLFYLAIQNKDGDFKHFSVPEEVYAYVKQIEAKLKKTFQADDNEIIDKSDALRYRWLKRHNHQVFKLSNDEVYLHICDRHSSEAVQDIIFDDIDATIDRLIKGIDNISIASKSFSFLSDIVTIMNYKYHDDKQRLDSYNYTTKHIESFLKQIGML